MLKHLKYMILPVVLVVWSVPAHADTVFLLQLGSFDNPDTAKTRWAQLQEKYPQLLEGLSVRLLDVTLPPDNFTVYRTQAGALRNRSDAQIICDSLTERGDECYVVETAMFQPDARASELVQRMPAAEPEPVMPAPAGPVRAEMPEPTQDIERALDEAAALPPVRPVEAPPATLNPPASASVAPLPPAGPMPVKAASASPDDDSFWDWINPFAGSSEPEQPQANKPTIAEPRLDQDSAEQELAQMDEVIRPTPRPVFNRSRPQPLMGYVSPPGDNGDDVLPPVRPMPPNPSSSADVTLPPPPRPSSMASNTNPLPTVTFRPPIQPVPQDAQAKAAMMAGQPAYVPAPMPRPQALPFQVKRDGVPVTPPPARPVTAGTPNVMVAEAVPVPVSQSLPRSPGVHSVAELLPLGMPSDSRRQRDLWAQISYFDSQQQALAFWDAFLAANQTFPAVRVRITNPYMQTLRSKPRVSLRVGPFKHAYMIEQMCDEVRNEDTDCKLVRDLGGSVYAGARRSRGLAQREARGYRQSMLTREPMYWVQIGAYPTPDEAKSAWRQLKQRHGRMLNDITPDIAAPDHTSSADVVYRLRAGPYAMRPGADALCQNMRMKGTKCLTIFSQ